MKTYSIEKPSKLEAVGNGSYNYRFNYEEVNDNEFAKWQCDEVTIWAPVTSDKITEAVISTLCPQSREQKLVNEFNSATLGMITGETAEKAITRYKDFLQQRAELKAMIDADCEELGIR